MPNQKNFSQFLIFVKLHQHAENEDVPSTCSGEILDLKILQSDWLAESILAYISGTRFFTNIGLSRNTANNKHFYY